jgi:heme exporter protein B
MKNAFHIFKKDMKQEFKTRYALNAIFLFSIVTLFAVSFSIGVFNASQEMLAALLWIILFFSSMSGLSHIFVKEEETGTAETLKLFVAANDVWLGKLMFNLVILFSVMFIVVPLYLAVMNVSVANIPLFLLTLFLGGIGLAVGGTIIAAIIAKASSKGALFTVLSFPVLLPVLISGISSTKMALEKKDFFAATGELQTLFAYGVAVITASVLLFEFIWEEK